MTLSFRATRNLGLFLLLAIIFLESLFSYNTMSENSSQLQLIVTVDEVKLRSWYDVAEIIANAKDALYDYKLGKREVIAPVDLMVNRAIKEINSIKTLATAEDEIANIEEIDKTAQELRQIINTYRTEIISKGSSGGASAAALEDTAIKVADHVTIMGREAAAYISKKIENNNKAILETTHFSRKMLGLVLIVAIMATIIVAVLMARALSKPIKQLVDGTKRLAEGDLSHRVAVKTEDEIGQLAASFNLMAEELKKSNHELTSAKAYTDNIIKSMTNSLVVINQSGIIQIVNKATCELLEYEEAELVGQPFAKVFAEGYFSGIGLDNLIHEGFTSNVETTYRSKSGRKIRVLFSGSVFFDDNGKFEGLVCVAQDITIQAEAMQASHLASIGELASGVAHEINNPINGIINFAQLLADDIDSGETVSNEIPLRIIREGDRVATIVSSLLSFAREGETTKKELHIHEVVEEVLALTKAQAHNEGIKMTVDVPSSLPATIGNFQQIQQVFLNLINNSRYALNKKYDKNDPGMIIDIKGTQETVDGRIYIRISFYDQGTGIPPNIIDKVLNPFFSTKPAGTGTGLGLAISHGIITDHDGKLVIDSTENEYTRINIFLPTITEEDRETPA